MRRSAAFASLILCFAAACATPPAQPPAPQTFPTTADGFISPRFKTFASDEEFLAFVNTAQREARADGRMWAWRPPQLLAQNAEQPCPEGELCPMSDDDEDAIVVTGSRIAASPPSASITNNQTAGVDEGDIVKQIGQFIIVLQDGRLFVVDTRPRESGLALADRANVYRDENDGGWYDEMLVQDHRIVVTGYSYAHEASELSVFSIGDDGRLTREGAYFISSNDYYDTDNYASRLVGDRLIIYTPMYLGDIDVEGGLHWPVIRQWRALDANRGAPEQGALSEGRPLLDARHIYKPLRETPFPSLHTVTTCPLGGLNAGDELDCDTVGFIGPPKRQFYVSPTNVFLWLNSNAWERNELAADKPCTPDQNGVDPGRASPALLISTPITGGPPAALFARGEPLDQFGLDASDTAFRALLFWNEVSCGADTRTYVMRYFNAPFDQLSNAPQEAPQTRYTPLPDFGDHSYVNRFTDDYVVYGENLRWRPYPTQPVRTLQSARVVAVPTEHPESAVQFTAPHNIIRAERVGDDIALTGYRDSAGLSVSIVDLQGAPHISDTEVVSRRYESENRSHAFNSLVDENGAGLLGVPTVEWILRAGRWWWRSQASDVSFLSLDAHGRLTSIGALDTHEAEATEKYFCEVSCIDWYGNTRPIFTDGRVFALSGLELIEGEVKGARIDEIARLNLTSPVGTRVSH